MQDYQEATVYKMMINSPTFSQKMESIANSHTIDMKCIAVSNLCPLYIIINRFLDRRVKVGYCALCIIAHINNLSNGFIDINK